MKINYDKTADAMYIYFKKGKVYTTRKITPAIFIDINKDGSLIGLEILDASRYLSQKNGHRYMKIGNKSFDVSYATVAR